MLLNERNRDMIREAVKHYGLGRIADKGTGNSNTFLQNAADELGYGDYWNRYIERTEAKILDNEIGEILIKILLSAAKMKGLEEKQINRIKRRIKNFNSGIEHLNTEQIKSIYKDLSIIKAISEKPQVVCIWRFYQILEIEDKNKFLNKILSLPIPQPDVEFVPVEKNADGIMEKHTFQEKEMKIETLISALYKDTFKQIEKNSKPEAIFSLIASELDDELENPALPIVMELFPTIQTGDKILLYLLRYLYMNKENSRQIMKFVTEFAYQLKMEYDDDTSIETLNTFYIVFSNMLEKICVPNYIPIPILDFKRDLDVKSFIEPSIEDLTESEKEDLQRFFDNDDMKDYLLRKRSKEDENEKDYYTNFKDDNYDIEDMKDNEEYFVISEYNEANDRFLFMDA